MLDFNTISKKGFFRTGKKKAAKYEMITITNTFRKFIEKGWSLNTTHNENCLIGLKQIPSDSFDVVVTSPPYWGQRGSDGLGSEPDPRDYIGNLVTILVETMRCLKPSGTFAPGQFFNA